MNDRFIRKHLYQVGLFYQVDLFNPVYLDKTGQLIKISDGKLKNWNGNLQGFQFTSENDLFHGKFKIDQFWYHDIRQNDFDDGNIREFQKFILDTDSIAIPVYEPKYFNRIGLRMQFIAKKISASSKAVFSNFYTEKFVDIQKIGSISTTAIGFDVVSKKGNIRVNISYAKKETENDLNAPTEGLLFDMDYFNQFPKEECSLLEDKSTDLINFAIDSYKEIICDISKEMGLIDEA